MTKICVYCGNEADYVCCGEVNGIVDMTEEEREKLANGELTKEEWDVIYRR